MMTIDFKGAQQMNFLWRFERQTGSGVSVSGVQGSLALGNVIAGSGVPG